MKQRHANGQLLPLRKRLTEAQMTKRDERLQYRTSIARSIGMMNFGLNSFFNRSFLGRLKWLLTGK